MPEETIQPGVPQRHTMRQQGTGTIQEERLERIPSVKKLAGPEKKLNTRYANIVIFGRCMQTAQ